MKLDMCFFRMQNLYSVWKLVSVNLRPLHRLNSYGSPPVQCAPRAMCTRPGAHQTSKATVRHLIANCESYLLGSIQISTTCFPFSKSFNALPRSKVINIASGANDVVMMPHHSLIRNSRIFPCMRFASPIRGALPSVPSENAHQTEGAHQTECALDWRTTVFELIDKNFS